MHLILARGLVIGFAILQPGPGEESAAHGAACKYDTNHQGVRHGYGREA
jgi:hypothetical protein